MKPFKVPFWKRGACKHFFFSQGEHFTIHVPIWKWSTLVHKPQNLTTRKQDARSRFSYPPSSASVLWEYSSERVCICCFWKFSFCKIVRHLLLAHFSNIIWGARSNLLCRGQRNRVHEVTKYHSLHLMNNVAVMRMILIINYLAITFFLHWLDFLLLSWCNGLGKWLIVAIWDLGWANR